MNQEQINLLKKLGLPTEFDGLSDDELIEIEERISDEMLYWGVNDAGDGLNEYGELCRQTIIDLPDD